MAEQSTRFAPKNSYSGTGNTDLNRAAAEWAISSLHRSSNLSGSFHKMSQCRAIIALGYRDPRDLNWRSGVPFKLLIKGDLQVKRRFFSRNEWQQRVNPVFVRYWLAMKHIKLASSKDPRSRTRSYNEAAAASRELANEINKLQPSKYSMVWAEIIRPLDGENWPGNGEIGRGYAVNPEASAFFRNLVFLRFGISYRELITLAEKDPSAHKKLLRVHALFYNFKWGGRGFENLTLKFNMNHFQIIVQGLDFGLHRLNESELQACFNEICPCSGSHSGEYTKKQFYRMKKACDRLIQSATRPTSFKTP